MIESMHSSLIVFPNKIKINRSSYLLFNEFVKFLV